MADKLRRVRSTRHRRRRSHKLIALSIVVIVVAGVGAGTDVAYSALKTRADSLQAELTADLQAGQRELEAGKASLTAANSKHDATLAMQAVNHFQAAKDQFIAAATTADNSKLLRYLEYAPSVGDLARLRHKAVDGISEMGAALSDAGQALSALDAHIIEPARNNDAGRTLLTVLDEAEKGMASVRNDFNRAQAAAADVDVAILPISQQTTFLKARDSIAAALSGVDDFESLYPVIKEMLGGNGVRTYLVEQVNPAELRAGGGFIGTYSLIRADHGSLSVVQTGDALDLIKPRILPWQPGFIPQPSPFREIIPDASWSFIDSNLYPDFPSNAKIAESFVQPRTGKLDGVISMDYYTVGRMLALTGPIALPGYETVTSDNFIQLLIQPDVAQTLTHKGILISLARPLLGHLLGASADQWPAILMALNDLVTGRHLQAYFDDPAIETEMNGVGWSGTLNVANASDFMMEIEDNYFGNKANYFLSRHFTVALALSGRTLHHVVTVDLVNREPFGLEDRTTYKAVARLYVGLASFSPTSNLRRVRFPDPPAPKGTRLIDGWVADAFCCGYSVQVVFRYDTTWSPADRGRYEIYWQKQPGTLNDPVAVIWTTPDGHPYTANAELREDLVITLSPTSVRLSDGSSAHAIIPKFSLG